MMNIIKHSAYKRGDWIRFYREGKLIIGEVAYVYENTINQVSIATDAGSVHEDCVLEIRPAQEQPE